MTVNTYPISWSASRVSTFKQCPRKLHEEAIKKSVPFEKSEAMKAGDVAHQLLDKRIAQRQPFPPGHGYLEPIAQAIAALPGETFTERQMTLNASLQPTGWFAKDAWVRASADVMKVMIPQRFIWIGDYKTGKIKFDEYQLKLYAAVAFHHFPDVDTVKTNFIWLRDKIINGSTYTRLQVPDLWRELLPVPMEMQQAAIQNHWPARPSRLCKWCTVNKYGKCDAAQERYSAS